MANPWRIGFLEGLRPEQPLTVSEWADRYRKLSSKASAEPGPWRTGRTPYLREPMDCLSSNNSIQRVVMTSFKSEIWSLCKWVKRTADTNGGGQPAARRRITTERPASTRMC